MIRRLAVLLALLPSLAGAQAIRYTAPPGVAEISSYSIGCIPKATSSTGLVCGSLTDSGTAITSTVPILVPAGSVGAPGLAWKDDTDTGIRFEAGTYVTVVTNGADRVNISALGLNVITGPVLLPQGQYNAPSLASAAFPTLGIYFDGFNMVFVAGGEIAKVASDAFNPGSSDSKHLGGSDGSNLWKDFGLARGISGSKVLALTESSATTFATVAVPQTAGVNFAGGRFIYTVYASDGTDSQTLDGEVQFSAANKAGTETCSIADAQTAAAVSAGTLACTITCVTGLTDVIGLAANCASSLTQTSLTISYRYDMPQPNTVVPNT